MAAHAVETTTTEDMIEVMTIGIITADHTEVVVAEEEDGELHRTETRSIEDGHLLLTTVAEGTDHVQDLDHTHLVATKA